MLRTFLHAIARKWGYLAAVALVGLFSAIFK